MPELWNLDPAGRALAVLVGMTLLVAGRRLFWLLVALAGFVVGWLVAGRYLLDLAVPPVAVAMAAGVLGAVAALFVQKLAVTVAGLVVGALLGAWLIPFLPPQVGEWSWLIVIVAALLGAVGAQRVFAAALTVLSAAAGSLLLVETAGLHGPYSLLTWLGLTAVGLFAQRGQIED